MFTKNPFLQAKDIKFVYWNNFWIIKGYDFQNPTRAPKFIPFPNLKISQKPKSSMTHTTKTSAQNTLKKYNSIDRTILISSTFFIPDSVKLYQVYLSSREIRNTLNEKRHKNKKNEKRHCLSDRHQKTMRTNYICQIDIVKQLIIGS